MRVLIRLLSQAIIPTICLSWFVVGQAKATYPRPDDSLPPVFLDCNDLASGSGFPASQNWQHYGWEYPTTDDGYAASPSNCQVECYCLVEDPITQEFEFCDPLQPFQINQNADPTACVDEYGDTWLNLPEGNANHAGQPNEACDKNCMCRFPMEMCIDVDVEITNHYEPKNPPPYVPPPPYDNPCQNPSLDPMCGDPGGEPPPEPVIPADPPGFVPVTTPDPGECPPGTGFSFEGSYEGWKPVKGKYHYPVFLKAPPGADPQAEAYGYKVPPQGPVFGNNVSVSRLRPPGYSKDDFLRTPAVNMSHEIGGDYWMFSRDVRQHGNYWIGSADYRPRPSILPGMRNYEKGTGLLKSPVCKDLSSSFISFRIGGLSSNRHYVALAVREKFQGELDGYDMGVNPECGRPGQEEVPDHSICSTWSPSDFDPNDAGSLGLPDTPDESWKVVFRSTSRANMPRHEWDKEPEWMARTVVWALDGSKNSKYNFIGREIMLIIVDDNYDSSVKYGNTHINVDDFRFLDKAPKGTVWLTYNRSSTAIGEIIHEQPLWGLTDAHAHPTANITMSTSAHRSMSSNVGSLGAGNGTVVWGDPSDPLEDVYNCASPLDPIDDKHGNTVRKETLHKNGAVGIDTHCSVDVDIVLSLVLNPVTLSAVTAICAAENIDWVWSPSYPFQVQACTVDKIADIVSLLDMDALHAWTSHGGQSFASGGLEFQEWFMETLLTELGDSADLYNPGVTAALDPRVWNADLGIKEGGADHHHQGLGLLHNQYQHDMIKRAYQGGLRVMVMDVVHSYVLPAITDNANKDKTQYKEGHDVKYIIGNGVDSIKRLVAQVGDPDYLPGVLREYAEIAYSHKDLDRIVRQGKLAIILGVEVPRLDLYNGPHGDNSAATVIKDLYHRLGIRKLTFIHGVDNSMGGTAIFVDAYQTANMFDGNIAGEDDYKGLDYHWDVDGDSNALPFLLSAQFPPPFGLFMLIDAWDWKMAWEQDLPDDKQDLIVTDPYYDYRVQNHSPDKWTGSLETTYRFGMTTTGGHQLIPFFYGLDKPQSSRLRLINVAQYARGKATSYHAPLYGAGANGRLELDFHSNDALYPMRVTRIDDMDFMIGGEPACNTEGTIAPEHLSHDHRSVEEWETNNLLSQAHVNIKGLTTIGEDYLLEAARHGMFIGFDHFSQKARIDAYQALHGRLAKVIQVQKGGSIPDYYYPGVFGEHTHLREAERDGPVPEEYRSQYGFTHEAMRSQGEFKTIKGFGGFVAPLMRTSTMVPPGTPVDEDDVSKWPEDGIHPYWKSTVKNDCDYSSKTWAIIYLNMLRLLEGRNVLLSSDFNPTTVLGASRFGAAGIRTRACRLNPHPKSLIHPLDVPEQIPRDFNTPRVGADGPPSCLFNLEKEPDIDGWDPFCPSTRMIWSQSNEYSGVWYEEYEQSYVNRHQADSEHPFHQIVTAREENTQREDRLVRAPIKEYVTVNMTGMDAAREIDEGQDYYSDNPRLISQQMFPFKQFDNRAALGLNQEPYRGWDFNLDGMAHEGMLPDFLQDVRNVGVSFEQMGYLFNSPGDLYEGWKRACELGDLYSDAKGIRRGCNFSP